jgi:hypothetical protein
MSAALSPAIRETVVGIFYRHVRGLGFIGHTVKITRVRPTKRGYSASILLQQGTVQRRYRGTITGTKVRVTAVADAERIAA